jgi:cell wall-associated NlpC family hydrolase
MGLRRALNGIVVVLATVLGGGSWQLLSEGGSASARSGIRAAPTAELPPLPKPRPKLVEPVAGQADAVAVADEEPAPATGIAKEERTPKPKAAASDTQRRAGAPAAVRGGISKATALDNGVALQPLQAPAEVLKIIEAGNAIARSPYKWGGGHGRWQDTGYDCSGSVSFALYFAGLLDGPRDSGRLMKWGKPGPGKWVTVYANAGHVYMEVAGIRFDTSGAKATGSRWQNDLRGRRPGFVARHPAGL